MSVLLLLSTLISFCVLNADTSQSFPEPLNKKEEYDLFVDYFTNKNQDARAKLIKHNLRLVAHIVRKYYGSSEDVEDLISVGTIGLIKSVDSFDIKKGAKFATYSAKCIQNEILMYFRNKKKTALEVSINGAIDTDKEGNSLTYMDIIKCDDTIADDLDTKLKICEIYKYINSRLTARERKIIILRYGLNGIAPLTQRETAEKLGISRSYVSRLEKSVLKKIEMFLCNGDT
ncbi:MAG: RNA polymerase sporulation sigma factor SigK [Clostridia bacterium]|nr:RNA polymerase sporulation sigma factor SigK [Clostridia bacterium]